MHTKGFVQISQDFSDGVSLQKDGPVLIKDYSSECVLEGGRSFVTAASFVSKFVPKIFVTTLKVDDKLTYFESITFERWTVMQNFSETISLFEKDKVNKFCSRLLFDPSATKRSYIAGIKLWPAQKCFVSEEGDDNPCGKKSAMNGDISGHQLINGDA